MRSRYRQDMHASCALELLKQVRVNSGPFTNHNRFIDSGYLWAKGIVEGSPDVHPGAFSCITECMKQGWRHIDFIEKKRGLDNACDPDILLGQEMDIIEAARGPQGLGAAEMCPDDNPVTRHDSFRPDLLQANADPSRGWNKVFFVFEAYGITINFRPAHLPIISLEVF